MYLVPPTRKCKTDRKKDQRVYDENKEWREGHARDASLASTVLNTPGPTRLSHPPEPEHTSRERWYKDNYARASHLGLEKHADRICVVNREGLGCLHTSGENGAGDPPQDAQAAVVLRRRAFLLHAEGDVHPPRDKVEEVRSPCRARHFLRVFFLRSAGLCVFNISVGRANRLTNEKSRRSWCG